MKVPEKDSDWPGWIRDQSPWPDVWSVMIDPPPPPQTFPYHKVGVGEMAILVSRGYYNKVPLTRWLLKANLFLPALRLTVQDLGASMVRCWWQPSLGLQTANTLLCPHVVEKGQAGSLASSFQGTKPTHEGSTLMTWLPPKGPHPNTIPLRTGASVYGFWQAVAQAFSPWQRPPAKERWPCFRQTEPYIFVGEGIASLLKRECYVQFFLLNIN